MPKKFLLYIASVLLLGIGFLSIDPTFPSEYTIFSSNFEKIFYTLSLTSLVLLISSSSVREPVAGGPIFAWKTALAAVLLMVASCFLLANPYGTLPWMQRSAYIGLKFRTTKLDLYKAQETTPEILIFGSSRAFSIDPTTLESILNKKAFNFSVEGGSPVDFLAFYNYYQQHTNSAGPSLVLIELVSPRVGVNVWEQSIPIEMTPYLPPALALKHIEKLIANSININSIADALYITFYPPDEQKNWLLLKDGHMEPQIPDREAAFQAGASKAKATITRISQCDSLDKDGITAVRQLVEITRHSNTAIVFYRSPLSIDFYNSVDTNTDLFIKCQTLFDEFMDSLQKNNPHVYFTDLSRYNSISDQGLNVFIDYQHLAPNGADMVIQALVPQLKEALQWASKNRK